MTRNYNPYYAEATKESKLKAACRIQSVYRLHRAKAHVMLLKEKTRRKNHGQLITGKALLKNGRRMVLQVISFDNNKSVLIRIFDMQTCLTQEFNLPKCACARMSLEESNEFVQNICKGIEFHEGDETYYLSMNDTITKGEMMKEIEKPKNEPKEKKKIDPKLVPRLMREVYSGLRKIGEEVYNAKCLLNLMGEAEIYVTKNEPNAKPQVIKVPVNLQVYLEDKKEQDKEAILGSTLCNLVYYDTNTGKVAFNLNKLQDEVTAKEMEAKGKVLRKIQDKVKGCMARNQFYHIVAAKTKKVMLVGQFGLKLGKCYHFIKVIKQKDNDDLFWIKSNYAINALKVSCEKLGITKLVDADPYNLKCKLLERVPTFLAYDNKRRILVEIKRRPEPTVPTDANKSAEELLPPQAHKPLIMSQNSFRIPKMQLPTSTPVIKETSPQKIEINESSDAGTPRDMLSSGIKTPRMLRRDLPRNRSGFGKEEKKS